MPGLAAVQTPYLQGAVFRNMKSARDVRILRFLFGGKACAGLREANVIVTNSCNISINKITDKFNRHGKFDSRCLFSHHVDFNKGFLASAAPGFYPFAC